MAAFFGFLAIGLGAIYGLVLVYDAFKFVYGGDSDDRVS